MTTPPSPVDREREELAQQLMRAVGQGHLTLAQFDKLSETLWAATTHEEIEAVRQQAFPTPPPPPLLQPLAHYATVPAVSALQPMKTLFGTIERTGVWQVPAYSAYVVNGGDLELDLREAQTDAEVIVFDITANMSDISITVPPGVSVTSEITGPLNDFYNSCGPAAPGAPTVVLRGHCRACSFYVETSAPGESSWD